MRTYQYEAKLPTGQVEQGVAEGESVETIARDLRAKGYFVVKVKETRLTSGRAERLQREVLAPIFCPASPKALSIFFSSMRAMLGAGFSVLDLGHTLAQQTNNPILKQAAADMAEAAKEGRPMSSVLRKYPSAFDKATISMIEAGEHSGALERTAQQLAAYFDRMFELAQMYRWQTFYPKILLIAIVVLPTIQTLIFNPGAWLGMILGRTIPLVSAILLLWYGYRVSKRLAGLRQTMDLIKLSLPWVGSMVRRGCTARWARALAMLLRAGVPIHQALVAAASTAGNGEVERNLIHAAKGVQEGHLLAEVFASVPQIPRMAQDMLATAERAGSTEDALDRVATYYESETEVGGKQGALVVGVVIFAIIALIIGYMVVSFWGQYAQGMANALGGAATGE
jgi:type II secretory pathway component PulF